MMHTVIAIFGVVVYIIFAIALLSTLVGLVWVIFPLEDKAYIGQMLIYQNTPMGGRTTGLCILGFGLISLLLGFLLDGWHVKLAKNYGSRT
jgi:hypothetical protein